MPLATNSAINYIIIYIIITAFNSVPALAVAWTLQLLVLKTASTASAVSSEYMGAMALPL
jgi:hypothetical protein